MTSMTRNFVIGSSAVLITGLCVGLVAYHGGLPTGAFGGETGPTELAYVPADAAVVAFADVQQVMNSDLRRRLKSVLPTEDKDRAEFEQATGIDVERDIDHVVAALVPRDGRESGFVALRGTFDRARLEGLAQQHHAAVADYRGIRIYKAPSEKTEGTEATEARRHRHGPAVAFVEDNLIMVGEEAAIRTAIDTRAGDRTQTVMANPEVRELIESVVDTNANAWAVGRLDLLASRANLPSNVASQIPAVKWFAASGHINGGMSGRLRAETRDEQSAQNLRDVLNGFLALGRMQAGSYPQFQELVNSIQLGGSGTTVELSFVIPTELLDALEKMAGAHRHQKEM